MLLFTGSGVSVRLREHSLNLKGFIRVTRQIVRPNLSAGEGLSVDTVARHLSTLLVDLGKEERLLSMELLVLGVDLHLKVLVVLVTRYRDDSLVLLVPILGIDDHEVSLDAHALLEALTVYLSACNGV